jgi:hypothetical protein
MTINGTRLGLVAALAGLLLAGCGGGTSSATDDGTTTTASRARLVPATLAGPQGCFLTVFLSEGVSPAQRREVEALLLGSRRVREVSFVSKELALRRFARQQPDVAKNMHVNPFPDRYEVVPGTRIDVFAIITQFASGVDGITNVRASAACGAQ